MPLRSCCLTLAGSRVCALARLRDRSESACAFRQAGHLQPLVHRARVPWPNLALTRVRLARYGPVGPLATNHRKVSASVRHKRTPPDDGAFGSMPGLNPVGQGKTIRAIGATRGELLQIRSPAGHLSGNLEVHTPGGARATVATKTPGLSSSPSNVDKSLSTLWTCPC
jgi:hypothetical protein